MNHRTRLLLILTGILCVPLAVHWYRVDSLCQAALQDPTAALCTSALPRPGWFVPLVLLSVVTGVTGIVYLVGDLIGRRNERNLLQQAGVRVEEDELPLE
jgi:hypothetical protein